MQGTLRARILLGATVVVASTLTLVYVVLSYLFLAGYRDLERSGAAADADRARALLADELGNLQDTVGPWTMSTVAAEYVATRDAALLDELVTPRVMHVLHVDGALFFDTEGRQIVARMLSADGGGFESTPADVLQEVAGIGIWARFRGAGEQRAGVLSLPTRTFLAAARPIASLDGKGPVVGSVVILRRLDESVTSRWSVTLGVPVQAWGVQDNTTTEENKEVVTRMGGKDDLVELLGSERVGAYRVVRDMSGSPGVVVGVVQPRAITAQGKHALVYLLGALVGVGAALVVILSALLGRLLEVDEARRGTQRLYEAFVERSSEGIFMARLDGWQLMRVNQAARRMLGIARGDATTLTVPELFEAEPEEVNEALEQIRTGDRVIGWQTALRRGTGSNPLDVEIHASLVEHAGEKFASFVMRDVTERRLAEERIRFLAYHDPLTGLPNRLSFQDTLDRVLRAADDSRESVAVLFLDLDHFKEVNDTLGHEAGDELLREVAARVSGTLREGDVIARQGGDEFLVLLPNVEAAEEAMGVAKRLRDAVRVPVRLGSNEVRVGASVGVAVFPADGRDAVQLVRNADLAMYQAKEKGRGTVERFDLALDQRLSDIVEMKNKLAIAVERGDFELHYQPEVAVKDGKIGAFEALIRWNSPDLGLVPPSRFIPLAEESGLIVPIGEWVLRTACNQLVEWRSRGIDVPVVAINLSARQLALPDLVDIVRAILVETGAEPAWIQIEVTETSAMKDPEAARRTLTSLKELGVSIALDDFGTGYSALAYLRRFPFDRLKLDRTFLRDLAQSADNQALVRGIIALAGSLNLEVVAEGVETVAQFELLCRYGCDYLQGYGLCRPVPAADAEALLRNGSRLFERMMPAGAPPPPDNVHELRRRV